MKEKQKNSQLKFYWVEHAQGKSLSPCTVQLEQVGEYELPRESFESFNGGKRCFSFQFADDTHLSRKPQQTILETLVPSPNFFSNACHNRLLILQILQGVDW